MKEILKEVAPGVWTHSHWEDENGNIVVEPNLTAQTAFERKSKELLDSYYNTINTKVQYLDKEFGCNEKDRATLNDVLWAIDKGIFPYETMPWNTYLGKEKVNLTKEQIAGLKVAIIMLDQTKWVEYSQLDAQLKAIDLESENAIALIEAIPLVS